MEKNRKSFRDEIVSIAEIADKIENTIIFKNSKITINAELNSDSYKKIQSNFREVDKNHNNFSIVIDDITFNFTLKN